MTGLIHNEVTDEIASRPVAMTQAIWIDLPWAIIR